MKKRKKANSYLKTEEILYSYPALKKVIDSGTAAKQTEEIASKIERGLQEIVNDPYYEVIALIYFEGKTLEDVAGTFNVSSQAISYARKRLVNQLKVFIFTERFLDEVFN